VDLGIDFERALRGGHLAELQRVAARGVLDASQGTIEDALALLRDVVPADPAEDWDPAPYIETNEWTFATTMPEHPHEYLLIRNSVDWREHLIFVRWLRVHGQVETYRGRRYRYRVVNGWRYWALGPSDSIANRRREP
jgi:hypothetical protein